MISNFFLSDPPSTLNSFIKVPSIKVNDALQTVGVYGGQLLSDNNNTGIQINYDFSLSNEKGIWTVLTLHSLRIGI